MEVLKKLLQLILSKVIYRHLGALLVFYGITQDELSGIIAGVVSFLFGISDELKRKM